MCNKYNIYHKQSVVGEAIVSQEGLFYHFQCLCRIPSKAIHHVIVSNGNKKFNLGVCIPQNKQFSSQKRIPIKHFDSQDFTFNLIERDQTQVAEINPAKPFDFLADLEDARLDDTDDSIRILFSNRKDLSPIQPDSDPIP